MIPVGTRVRVEIAPGAISIAAGRFAGQEGEVAESRIDVDPTLMTCVNFDNGTSAYVYNREIQVLDLAPSAEVMNGHVSIGDTVAWPQRTGSHMWMTIGRIVNIKETVVERQVTSMCSGFGGSRKTETYQDTVSKITIVDDEGAEKSTSVLDRVVKVCPTTTS